MFKEVKWGEFRIGDLFKIEKTRSFNKDSLTVGNEFDYVTRTSINQGVLQTTGYVNDENINPAGTWSLGLLQMDFFYRNKKWYAGQFVRKVSAKIELSKYTKNFFTTVLNSISPYLLTFAVRFIDEEFENYIIQLPILEDGEINFSFMEKFIAELEATHIAELDAYLSVTGLKDYELTEEERQALEDFENKEWVNPKIEELFKVRSYKKRFDANKVTILEKGEYPYIVRTAFNNGVRGYLKEDIDYLNDENTISFGQDTATMFYQKTPYFTGDKIKILKHKDKNFNEEKALFLITSMRKSFKSFTWGAKSYSEKVIKSQKIKVPLNDKEIDYEFMEIFISAIKKLVIKDVVEFSNKKIEMTKEIINK